MKTIRIRINEVIDLSPTARELRFNLNEDFVFRAGSFVNIFLDIDGQRFRRAYSISSNPNDPRNISISVRRKKDGFVSNVFWRQNVKNIDFEVMGPLGKNTTEKIAKNKVFLFAFGIGVSVIKSVLSELVERENITEINVSTGSFDESEILYKDFFEETKNKNKNIRINTRYVLSNPKTKSYEYVGFIQHHMSGYDFNDSDVYICGQKVACDDLKENIEKQNPENIQFIVESFG